METARELAVVPEQEMQLGKDASSIERSAEAMQITTDEDYNRAAEMLVSVKGLLKRIKDYWEPSIKSAYETHKSLTKKRSEMEDSPKKAESVLKRKMSDYTIRKERERKEAEERARRLAQEEMERKLAEAVKAEESGDADAAEYAMAEAEAYDNAATTVTVQQAPIKAKGVTNKKDWEIVVTDKSKVPVEIAGVVIRPIDTGVVKQLVRATKGAIVIPGIKVEETVAVSVRAS